MDKTYGIVVVSYDNDLYRHFDGIRVRICNTENIPIVVAYNGEGPARENRAWEHYYTDREMNPIMYNKFLATCSTLLKTESWQKLDYIIRVNSSTFLNFKEIQPVINQLPDKLCFAGRALGGDCISGLFIIFSKDVLQKLIELGPTATTALNDDVVIGKTTYNIGIPRTLIEDRYIEFTNFNDTPTKEQIATALNNTFIRVKNNTDRKKIDHYIWDNLYQQYCEKYYV